MSQPPHLRGVCLRVTFNPRSFLLSNRNYEIKVLTNALSSWALTVGVYVHPAPGRIPSLQHKFFNIPGYLSMPHRHEVRF